MLGLRGTPLRWLIGVILGGIIVGGALGFGLRVSNHIGAHTVSVQIDNKTLNYYPCPNTQDSPQPVIGTFQNGDRVLATARDVSSAWLLTRSNADVNASVWVEAHFVASDASVATLPVAKCGDSAPAPSPTGGASPSATATGSPSASATGTPGASPSQGPTHPPTPTHSQAPVTILTINIPASDYKYESGQTTTARVVITTNGTGAFTLNMDYFKTGNTSAQSGTPDGSATPIVLSGHTSYDLTGLLHDYTCPQDVYEALHAYTVSGSTTTSAYGYLPLSATC